MTDEISSDGLRYVSAAEAALKCDLHRDYIARLAREGKVQGRRVGRNWYINEDSLKSFVIKQAYRREIRKKSLSSERTRDFLHSYSRTTSFESSYLSRHIAPEASGVVEDLNSKYLSEKKNLTSNLEQDVIPADRNLHVFLNSPAGITHAAMQSTHVTHFISPAMEFMHKLIAMTFAISVTFGTYALLDRQFERVAEQSIRENIVMVQRSILHLVSQGTMLATDTRRNEVVQSGAAAAADFPRDDDFVTMFVARIQSFVAPHSAGSSRNGFVPADTRGSVTVRVVPYSGTYTSADF